MPTRRIRCYLVEPSDQVRRRLRVDALRLCANQRYKGALCFAVAEHDTVTAAYAPNEHGIDLPDDASVRADELLRKSAETPWPTRCDYCGEPFADAPVEHVYHYVDRERMWRETESGALIPRLMQAEAGAMWRAPWMREHTTSQDDDAPLYVMTPGGSWGIDDQAHNCTLPDDRRQAQHHCWIRHGTPPHVTVDKSGVTCGAGAGSIQAGDYHGFLRDGYLED